MLRVLKKKLVPDETATTTSRKPCVTYKMSGCRAGCDGDGYINENALMFTSDGSLTSDKRIF